MKIRIKSGYWNNAGAEKAIHLVDAFFGISCIGALASVFFDEKSGLLGWGIAFIFYLVIKISYNNYKKTQHSNEPEEPKQ